MSALNETRSEEASVGIVRTQYATFATPPEAFRLDCGSLLGPVTLV
jgi:hypothetical protein